MAISEKLIQETEKRYSERENNRQETRRRIQSGGILQGDRPERVAKRLKRISRSQSSIEMLGRTDMGGIAYRAEVAPPPHINEIGLERILGKNDLLTINYLEHGIQAARSVGRIRIRTSNGPVVGYGTGFMVSPRLLLTNHHVLRNQSEAVFSQIEFNFQDDVNGQPLATSVFELQPNVFFRTEPHLDYTLVAVGRNDFPGTFGWNRLIEEEGKIILGEAVSIIQHPSGEPKQLALRENELIDLLEEFLHYSTDTAPGSSGSPVFNDQWEVVGLHHSGVPRRDEQGRLLTHDGTVWTSSMGEHRIHWIANEGVRISRIARDVKNLKLSGEQRSLRNEMFETVPSIVKPPEGSGPPKSKPVAESLPWSPVITGEGAAVWVIPFQVSVRLGTNVSSNTLTTPAAVSSPTEPAPDNKALREALAELEAARGRKYYDSADDQQNRDAYYENVDAEAGSKEFFKQLNQLLAETHTPELKYQPSQHVYPWVDLQPNRKLRSIYSQREFDPEELIREDLRIDQERTARLQERVGGTVVDKERMSEELDLLEALLPYNCEHVVPQSWFEKREPMRGDIHHLFACESGCNSFRGNTPYYDFPDFEEALRDECGKRVENKFEPSGGKGIVARATLYFLVRYPGEINRTAKEYQEDRLRTLLEWHASFPVSEYERHRNMAIFAKQGNRNPLIDFPEWAEKIDFREGLG